MSTPLDLAAWRELLRVADVAEYAAACRWAVPALLSELEGTRAERDELDQAYSKLLLVKADLATEVQRLRATLPSTCTLCGCPVQGVRCPDGCEPKVVTPSVTGEEKAGG